ncbi:hypothetical protein [Iodidimonas sp. SYSU 1G8]|uniref:hypothetical protein n=1 Tax=Iodidimonas sp. SYSU 1G8 TaxID=3133967 RepID=UPI0031FF1266
MTKARNAGTSWTDWFERHCCRSKALLVAVPLLLLSLVLDQSGQPSPGIADRFAQASDIADPISDLAASPLDAAKAQASGRAGTQISDATRSKFTPSGSNSGGGFLIPPLPPAPRHEAETAAPKPATVLATAPLAVQNGPRAPPARQV